MDTAASPRPSLPDHVLADIRSGRARTFRRPLSSMTGASILAALGALPLVGLAGVVAFAAATGDHDTPSMIFYGALASACLFGAFAIARRLIHHRRRLTGRANGDDLFGLHVTADYACALVDTFPTTQLVHVPRDAIVHVQHTDNHFYSENVSSQLMLVTLRTTQADRPYVVLSHTSFGTSADELRAALTDALGAPWSDEVEYLDDAARERCANYVSF